MCEIILEGLVESATQRRMWKDKYNTTSNKPRMC